MKPVLAGDIETKRIAQEKVVDAILPSGYAVGEQAPLHSVSCHAQQEGCNVFASSRRTIFIDCKGPTPDVNSYLLSRWVNRARSRDY